MCSSKAWRSSGHSTGSGVIGGRSWRGKRTALTNFGFTIKSYGSHGAFSQVTILPDSAIEVFDDPAKIGKSAGATLRVFARP